MGYLKYFRNAQPTLGGGQRIWVNTSIAYTICTSACAILWLWYTYIWVNGFGKRGNKSLRTPVELNYIFFCNIQKNSQSANIIFFLPISETEFFFSIKFADRKKISPKKHRKS